MERTNKSNLLFAVLFLLVCSLPLLALVAPGLNRGGALNEKRELAAMPELAGAPLAEVPAAYESWFNDHFGFRGLLVRMHSLFQYRMFNASSSPQVLPGRDGWMFYDGKGVRGGDPRRNHLAQLPATSQRMFRELKEQFEHNDRYFAEQGLTYLVVIVPDKWSVYSEQLPASVGPPAEQTSADLFLAYLRAETDLKILDLKEHLRSQRWQQGPLYHQVDSHWNDLGAFVAAGEMARFVGQYDERVLPLKPAVRDLEWPRKTDGDLIALLGLEGWVGENEPQVPVMESGSLTVENLPRPRYSSNANRFPIHTRQDGADLPRALILRDSYGDALLPWFAHSFSESRWVWTSNARRHSIQPVLDEVQPDIVIEEKAEKYLMFPIRYFTAPGRSAVVDHGKKKGK